MYFTTCTRQYNFSSWCKLCSSKENSKNKLLWIGSQLESWNNRRPREAQRTRTCPPALQPTLCARARRSSARTSSELKCPWAWAAPRRWNPNSLAEGWWGCRGTSSLLLARSRLLSQCPRRESPRHRTRPAEIFKGHRRARTVDNAEPRKTTLHQHRVYTRALCALGDLSSNMIFHDFSYVLSRGSSWIRRKSVTFVCLRESHSRSSRKEVRVFKRASPSLILWRGI